MPNYHVTKNRQENDWQVKREGAERISAKADTQKEAEALAKEFCSNAGGGEVRIHSPKGPIRDSDTVAPGHDPYPPIDKRH